MRRSIEEEEKKQGPMSPPSENSEYEQDFEPATKDNKTTHFSATGEQTIPKSQSITVSKTETLSESDKLPKKPE